MTAVLAFAVSADAQLTLTGGGLTLVQEGGAADAVPMNLATGAIPFANSDLGPELGIGFHVAANLNDQIYGNSNSWIGGDTNPFDPLAFAGIDLGGLTSNVQSIAFGRDNTGGFVDRNMGLYTLQYTQVANPSSDLGLATTGDATSGWAEIGTLDYGASEGPGTNYNETYLRHRYNFDPVDATGIRLVVPGTGIGGGTAIDEIELYDVAGPIIDPPPPPAPIEIASAAGFTISWDGNDGEFFDDAGPPDGAQVPNNAALAANGATPFASSDLGPQLGIDFHVTANINDGFYGNSNSWIGGDENPFAPVQFVGVALSGQIDVASVAWGRDNGNNTSDACGGQCTDRSTGIYTLQFTNVDTPNADTPDTGDSSTGWETIGTLDYRESNAEFTSYLRHEFDVTDGDGGLTATGIRLLVPTTGLGGGTAIDELEVYAVPEPSGFVLLFGCISFLLTRNRRNVG